MSLTSMRNTIADGLVLLMQGLLLADGVTPAYKLAKKGAIIDPTDLCPCCEVLFQQGHVQPYSSGGVTVGWQVSDDPIWMLDGIYDYDKDTTTTASETLMHQTADVLLPMLRSRVSIPNPNLPGTTIPSVYATLEEQPDRALRPRFPNGKTYLVHRVLITVKQIYTVTIVTP